MATKEELKNRKIGWGVSIGIHTLLLVLFILIMAWREPDPPVPEYGIELNFGLEETGSGTEQPLEPAPASEQEEQVDPDSEETEAVEETTPSQSEAEELPSEEEVEEILETQPIESPDVAEPPVTDDEIVEEVPDALPEVTSDVQPSEQQSSSVKEESPGVSDVEAPPVESASHGDDADEEGDKGDREGTLDSRALYGSQGGGGGPLLELSGWIWDFEPRPRDTSNENGKIVFEIKINSRGEIISVRTIEKSISPEVERIYRQEVESLTFSPLSTNTIPAPVSTGKITFIIRSK